MNRCIHLVFYTEAQAFAGGERVLSLLLNGLSTKLFKITCVCTSRKTMMELQRRRSRADLDFILFEESGRPSVWRTVVPLARLLAHLGPDILHCNSIDCYAGAYAIFAGQLARVPIMVGTIHTAGPHPQRTPLEKLFGWTVDHLLDAVILVSEYCRTPVLRDRHLGPTKLTVIHDGIDLPPPSPEPPGGAPRTAGSERPIIIGSAGQLIPHKSYDTLLKAAQFLAQQHDVHVTVFGEGRDRERLEKLARELDLSERIHLPGWQEDIYSALRLLDVFVLPSINESAGLVLLEAMACGLPVVATRVGGIPEYVADGETGLLVPPRDPGALAEAIASLIVDPAKRAAFGRAGRQRVEAHFTAERMVAETARLYRQLLEG